MTIQPRPISDEPDADLRNGKMAFLDHLDELRTRIIRSCIAIGMGMLVAFVFYDRLSNFILEPTLRALPPGTELVFIRPGEAFAFYLDVALIGGLVVAAPFVTYQVWGFIAPGLYAKEKKFAVPFVLLTAVGTIAGAMFSHYIMFPAMVGFFATFHPRAMKFMPSVEYTFELYKNLLIGLVLVFQMPTLVLFLSRIRLVTAGFLWRNIKYAILLIFIVAAVLTPSPDPWNQMVFAAPMIGLYIISIGVAWLVGPKREKRSPEQSGSTKLRLVIGAMVIEQARKHRRLC
jgi:sec-independent protein translocase protein TatC